MPPAKLSMLFNPLAVPGADADGDGQISELEAIRAAAATTAANTYVIATTNGATGATGGG